MKLQSFILFLFALVFVGFTTSCSKDEPVEITIDSSQPQGSFVVSKKGSIVQQNDTGSKGTVNYGKDSQGIGFIQFGSDFSTVLATGTVTVYLSTSSTFKADPAKGNPDLRLIGTVTKNGLHNFKLDPSLQSKFSHVILWCGSANIPFGYAKIE